MIVNQGILDIAEVKKKKKSTYIKENVSVGRKRFSKYIVYTHGKYILKMCTLPVSAIKEVS